ncbi:dynamin family protein [Rossellomorea aquimaris]|uniref:Dynamin family protein n=1 Tax=Rossellomorea aquimaris TaxID=189382 RepID=A0A366ELC4_9BACI|nr:dynamin family protein [Rossellomorea aquimaris]RBP02520.1 dynamin family protein [Rossellomorea aquimaris]
MSEVQLKERRNALSGFEHYTSIMRQLERKREERLDDVVRKQLNHYRGLSDDFRSDLSEIHEDRPNKTGRLLSFLEDYNTRYKSLIKGLDESFMLFVVGTGKYGKSTLINALLETEAAEVGVLPKTWKIDIYRKDIPVDQVLIKHRDNKEQKVSVEQAKIIIKVEEKRRSDSERIVNEKLKEYKNKVSSFEAFKELKLKLEREEIYNSDIVEMHWGMKEAPILENFYVVDTPGLTQRIMGEVRTNVQDYYHKADGVLWMLDATSIAASNAKKLVQDLEESLAKVGGKHQQNIIAVLNRIDLVYANQGEDGVKRVLADAEDIYKGFFRAIVPFSATQAFKGAVSKNEQMFAVSGMKILMEEIQHAFYKNAKSIQCNKKKESCSTYNNQVSATVIQYTDHLGRDMAKYREEMKKVDEQVKKECQKQVNYAKAQLNSYRKRVEENIRYQVETFINIKDSHAQKEFVNEEIFETERLVSMIKDLQNEASSAFSKLAENYINKIYFTEYPNLKKQNSTGLQKDIAFQINIGRDNAEEDLITYGSGVAAGLVASLFLGPLGLIVGGIVSWFAKQGIRDKVRNSLTEELNSMIKDLTKKVSSSIFTMKEDAYNEIISSTTNSFIEVYSFDHLTNLKKGEKEVGNVLSEGYKLIEDISKPTPDYYPALKEYLL